MTSQHHLASGLLPASSGADATNNSPSTDVSASATVDANFSTDVSTAVGANSSTEPPFIQTINPEDLVLMGELSVPPTPPNSPDNSRGAAMYRYEVSTISLFGMALVVCLLQTLAISHYDIVRLLMVPAAILFSVFCYEWVYYFSQRLTPRKRAFFDVKNILEKYQPHKGTEEWRFFEPEPPTPHVRPGSSKKAVVVNEIQAEEDQPEQDFDAWRTRHYENEYANALAATTPNEEPLFEGDQQDQGSEEQTTEDQGSEEQVTKDQGSEEQATKDQGSES